MLTKLAAVVAAKRWGLPNLQGIRMAQYAALSHEDKAKFYELSFANYQAAHPSAKFTEALTVPKEKLAKYFRKIKPAEDRLEMVALQKWYLETMGSMEGPTEKEMELYFSNKANVFAYVFRSLADQLGLVRREAADLMASTIDDLFTYINEITGNWFVTRSFF